MSPNPLPPRLRRRGRRFALLCGYPRCSGELGVLHVVALERGAPLPPARLRPAEDSGLRALIELQALEESRRAALLVLPEGFARTEPEGVWAQTRRDRLRRRSIESGGQGRAASHRPRPRVHRLELSATAPPLPALVQCPQCPRVHRISREDLASFLGTIAESWSADAANPPPGSVAEMVARTADPGRLAPANERPSAPALTGTWAAVVAAVARSLPELELLIRARYGGERIAASDFFVAAPDRSHLVALPDSDHEALVTSRIAARAEASRRARADRAASPPRSTAGG